MKKIARMLTVVAGLSLLLMLAGPAAAKDSDKESARGKELVASLGCTGCHVVEGKGGALGPSLDGIGKRMDDDKIIEKLVDPKASNPQSIMPAFPQLPKDDLKAIAEYLEYL